MKTQDVTLTITVTVQPWMRHAILAVADLACELPGCDWHDCLEAPSAALRAAESPAGRTEAR